MHDADADADLELLVKWKGLAYVHSQWVPRSVLDASDPANKRKVARFIKDIGVALPRDLILRTATSAFVASADGHATGAPTLDLSIVRRVGCCGVGVFCSR